MELKELKHQQGADRLDVEGSVGKFRQSKEKTREREAEPQAKLATKRLA